MIEDLTLNVLKGDCLALPARFLNKFPRNEILIDTPNLKRELLLPLFSACIYLFKAMRTSKQVPFISV